MEVAFTTAALSSLTLIIVNMFMLCHAVTRTMDGCSQARDPSRHAQVGCSDFISLLYSLRCLLLILIQSSYFDFFCMPYMQVYQAACCVDGIQ
jgi:hypothetical protein